MRAFRHVLVLCEDSPAGDQALFTASALAAQIGAKLTVMAAADVNMPGRKRCCGSGGMCLNQMEREDAAARVRRATVLLGDVEDAEFLTAPGTPARALISVAAQRSCDLIVVPGRRRGVLTWMSGENTGRAVRKMATVPVIETPVDAPGPLTAEQALETTGY